MNMKLREKRVEDMPLGGYAESTQTSCSRVVR